MPKSLHAYKIAPRPTLLISPYLKNKLKKIKSTIRPDFKRLPNQASSMKLYMQFHNNIPQDCFSRNPDILAFWILRSSFISIATLTPRLDKLLSADASRHSEGPSLESLVLPWCWNGFRGASISLHDVEGRQAVRLSVVVIPIWAASNSASEPIHLF